MGQFILSDAITDNPAWIADAPDDDDTQAVPDFLDKYVWQMDVRVVRPDSTVSELGTYDLEGSVNVMNDREYFVGDVKLDRGGEARDGIMITDFTWRTVQAHPDFSQHQHQLYGLLLAHIESPPPTRATRLEQFADGACADIRVVPAGAAVKPFVPSGWAGAPPGYEEDPSYPVVREGSEKGTFLLNPEYVPPAGTEGGAAAQDTVLRSQENHKRIVHLVRELFAHADPAPQVAAAERPRSAALQSSAPQSSAVPKPPPMTAAPAATAAAKKKAAAAAKKKKAAAAKKKKAAAAKKKKPSPKKKASPKKKKRLRGGGEALSSAYLTSYKRAVVSREAGGRDVAARRAFNAMLRARRAAD